MQSNWPDHALPPCGLPLTGSRHEKPYTQRFGACARRFQCWHLDCFTSACARDLTARCADTPPQTKMDDKMNHLAKTNRRYHRDLLTYTSAQQQMSKTTDTATLNDKGKYCASQVLDYSGERRKRSAERAGKPWAIASRSLRLR